MRKPEHVAELRALGSEYVVDSSAESFRADLGAALGASGATIGFDATGGGTLAPTILAGMEAAAVARGAPMNPYGSDVFKQLYVCVQSFQRCVGAWAWGVCAAVETSWILGPR